jgi:integrase/recombinase XerD
MSATEPRYCPISTLHRKLRQGTGSKGRARAAVTRRLCTIAGFYKYTVEEELLEHSPAAHVRRPRVDYESHAAALDRNELGALLVAAGLGPPTEHALISLNGLRVSEATGADIEHLDLERGHRTLTITGNGGKVVTIPLEPHTARAIDLVIGERTGAPVFLAADGAAAGPARHLHRRRLRRRRRRVTGAPAGKLRPTISTVGRGCLRPPIPNTRR